MHWWSSLPLSIGYFWILLTRLRLTFVQLAKCAGKNLFCTRWLQGARRSTGQSCRWVLMCHHRPYNRVVPSRARRPGSSILRHVAAYMPKGKVNSRSTSSVLRTRLCCHWELNPHSTPFMRTGDLRLESKRGASNEFTETLQLQWKCVRVLDLKYGKDNKIDDHNRT